jgi:hypothetical protein
MWKPDQQFQIPGLGMQPNAASVAVPQKLDSALLSSLNMMPEAIKSRETPPFNMADIRPPMVKTASNVMNMLSGIKQLQSANVTNQESKLTDIPLPSTFHSSENSSVVGIASSNARAQGQVDRAATSYAPPKASFDIRREAANSCRHSAASDQLTASADSKDGNIAKRRR